MYLLMNIHRSISTRLKQQAKNILDIRVYKPRNLPLFWEDIYHRQ